MKKLLEDVEVLVDAEYERAKERFGPINNGGDHHSYGVIKEEVEEVAEDFTQMNIAFERFWDDVKCDNLKSTKKSKLATLYKYASLLACEAIQVAAMAYKAQVTIDVLDVPDLQREKTMPRYIDADALYDNFKNGISDTEQEKEFNRVGRYLVRHAPTADVVPVVRGEWQWYEEWRESTTDSLAECQSAGYKCSVCGIELSEYLSESLGETVFADNYAEVPKIAFCPNCGADMQRESGAKE